jgi:hypothetical protein
MTKAPSFLANTFGGGQPTMTPQQMMLLRLLAMRAQSGG